MGFENYDTAVHIDIYSSIATDPTWGNLDAGVKNELQNITLFKELLQYLNPDVILVSVNRDIFISRYKLHDQIDGFTEGNSPDTKHGLDVNYTDSADFHQMKNLKCICTLVC